MKRFLLLCLLGIALQIHAQSSLVQWQNTIGGSNFEVANCVRQTADTGYIIAGFSRSFISGDKTEDRVGGDDYWVIKLNAAGNIQWQNTIGGNQDDDLNSVEQTTDGGYILGGFSFSGNSGDKTKAKVGGADYWVVKLDATGNIQWQNTIGGTEDDELFSAKQTADGGYILGGFSYSGISGDKTEANRGFSDYWVVKLDATGHISWQKTIGGAKGDDLWSIEQTSDGGFILGGSSYSAISGDKTENCVGVSDDYWVIKLSSTGTIEWQKTIGGMAEDKLRKAKQTPEGGYILAGYSFSKNNGSKTENNIGGTIIYPDYWVIKLDATGNITWQNTIGGTLYDYLHDVDLTPDGGYLLAGYSGSGISGDKTEALLGGAGDYWLVKIDNLGAVVWENTIGGDNNDGLFSIDNTFDNGYVLAGKSYSSLSFDKTEPNLGDADYWVLKLYPEGCVPQNYYADTDNDGFGSAATSVTACTAPAGYVLTSTDCNDASAIVNPGMTEICNFIDDDCNFLIDDDIIFAPVETATGPTNFCHGGSVLLSTDAGIGYTYQWYKNTAPISGALSSSYVATKQGNYKVNVSNSCGLSVTTTPIFVTVYPVPAASITPVGSLDICATGSVSLHAGTGTGFSYKWYKNNVLISGATSSIYNATLPANYKVRVTNSNGCSKLSAVVIVTSSCRTGNEIAQDLIIYPNPAVDQFTIAFKEAGKISQSIDISVLNMMGEEVFHQSAVVSFGNFSENIPFHQPAGIYTVKIISEHVQCERKIVIQ